MRRFELINSSSNKFWEVQLGSDSGDVPDSDDPDWNLLTVRFGRIGTQGQIQTKRLTFFAAFTLHDKLVEEKLKKGYIEVAIDPLQKINLAPARTITSDSPRLAPDIQSFVSRTTQSPHEGDHTYPTDQADVEADIPVVLISPPWLSTQKRSKPLIAHCTATPLPQLITATRETLRQWAQQFAWDNAYANITKATGTPPTTQSIAECKAVQEVEISDLLIWPPDERIAGLLLKPAAGSGYKRWDEQKDLQKLFGLHGDAAVSFVVKALHQDPLRHLELFTVIGSPDLAPTAARLLEGKAGRRIARKWLTQFPDHAISGLIPISVGPLGKPRQLAEKALRFLDQTGHRERILAFANATSQPAEVLAAVTEILDRDPLNAFPTRVGSLPQWLVQEDLPPLVLASGKGTVPPSGSTHLLSMLMFSTLEEPYAGIQLVKDACTAESLDQFVWALFEQWADALHPTKDAWAFTALGQLGGEQASRSLVSLITSWPSEGAVQRAKKGLRVLAAMSTDDSLMRLHHLSVKGRSSLRGEAELCLHDIADQRGISPEELGDRLVPRLGLDEHSTLELDFGPRQFRVGFDESLQPYVIDASGSHLKALPKPGSNDDPVLAATAASRWKAIKKDASSAAKVQLARMEQAMINGRSWSPDAFNSIFVQHPLLLCVARRLVWATVGEDDRPSLLFRVAEDRTLADINDESVSIHTDSEVTIPHRLLLSDSVVSRWGEVFGDYQLMQPFPQLGRAVFTFPDGGAQPLDSYIGLAPHFGLVTGLQTRGWIKGEVVSHGMIFSMEKHLSGGLLAELDVSEGFYPTGSADVKFLPIEQVRLRIEGDQNAVPASSLTPIQYSELIGDLETLRAS
jgi:predicted DNA-binding WGR domain protein